MGSGRDKRKKANPKAPGAGREKTERKTAAAEEKRRRRDEKRGADEDDIDALLARVRLEDAGGGVSVEDGVPPPSRRVNATLTAAPGARAGEHQLLLYGGEWYDNAKTRVYGDLFRFDPARRRWAAVRSPGAPPPRSAHQAALFRNFLFVFGGEFTSPNQERFLHYKDLWRLDLTTWQWEQLPLRGGPSARSGHRMVVHKSKLILFGGFYDAAKETKYYNDLWELDLETLKWTSLGRPGATAPPPRSGCQLALHAEAGICFLYGGYRKEPGDEGVDKGVVLSDCWALNLADYSWERVKKAGIAPGPRSGFSMAVHKGRAVLFGGVVDHEAKGGEALVSEFYNELYTFALDTRRWFPLALRGAPAAAAPAAAAAASAPASAPAPAPAPAPAADAAAAASPALHRAAQRIQACFRGYAVRKVLRVYRIGGVVSELLYAPALGFAPPRGAPVPFGRIGAQMAVAGNTLWMYGGMVECGDVEITFDDVWALDLNKLAGWECVHAGSVTKEELRAAAEGGAGGAASSDEDEEGDEEDE